MDNLNEVQKFWVDFADELADRNIRSFFKKNEMEIFLEMIEERPMDEWVKIILSKTEDIEKISFNRDNKAENEIFNNLYTVASCLENLKPNKLNGKQIKKLHDSLMNSFNL